MLRLPAVYLPAGISEVDWLATSAPIGLFILAQHQETEPLPGQLTLLATELASLWERIGPSSATSPNLPPFRI